MNWKVGQKIKFAAEKKRFTIRACDERYAVCTYPLNMIRRVRGAYEHEKTVMYTIVDLVEKRRGPENLVFGFGAESDDDCQEMLKRLNGKTRDRERSEVSHRRDRPLDIISIE